MVNKTLENGNRQALQNGSNTYQMQGDQSLNDTVRMSGVSVQDRNVLLLELWDSSVNIVICLRVGWQRCNASHQGQDILLSLVSVRTGCGAHPSSWSVGPGTTFAGNGAAGPLSCPPHLLLTLRMNGGHTSVVLYSFIAWAGIRSLFVMFSVRWWNVVLRSLKTWMEE